MTPSGITIRLASILLNGQTFQANLALHRRLPELRTVGQPWLLPPCVTGPSYLRQSLSEQAFAFADNQSQCCQVKAKHAHHASLTKASVASCRKLSLSDWFGLHAPYLHACDR